MGTFFFGALDGGGVFDDVVGVAEGLLRVPELDASNLGGMFDGDEGIFFVFDGEDAADGLAFFGVSCAAADGAVCADEGGVGFEDEAAVYAVGFIGGFDVERCAARGSPVDGILEVFPVECRRVRGQDVELPDADHAVLGYAAFWGCGGFGGREGGGDAEEHVGQGGCFHRVYLSLE